MSPATQSTDAASILLVGVGALGCAAAQALADDGRAHLQIVDDDEVESSNLQRQVLFGEQDLGCPKASTAVTALKRQFPELQAESRCERLDESNATRLISEADFVIDATDDPKTKFLINRVAIETNTPFCYGGVVRTSGQLLSVEPGSSACLACVFPDEAGDDDGGCSAQGILAPVAGVIGALQAGAAISALGMGIGPAAGRMMIYDIEGPRWRSVQFEPQADCPRCGGRTELADATAGPNLHHRRTQPCHS